MATAVPATTYPVLGRIIADIRLNSRGECLMPTERLQFWGRYLAKNFPPQQHPVLYQMLGGMTLEFAAIRAFASIQLYALATLGLSALASESLARESDFLLRGRDAADTLKLARAQRAAALSGAPATASGIAPAHSAGVAAGGTRVGLNSRAPFGPRTASKKGGG